MHDALLIEEYHIKHNKSNFFFTFYVRYAGKKGKLGRAAVMIRDRGSFADP